MRRLNSGINRRACRTCAWPVSGYRSRIQNSSASSSAQPVLTIDLAAPDYNLDETLSSGQAFRWRKIGGAWEGVIAGRWVSLEKQGETIRAACAVPQQNWEWLASYLQVDAPLREILAAFPPDEGLNRARELYHGLRLLRQEPWECLASFILSSTKQIVQIQQIVDALCRRFGSPAPSPLGRGPCFSFPAASVLAGQTETALRECKMGFRAPYLLGAAQMVSDGRIDLARLAGEPLDVARERLMELPGVGRKIADCVLLFAFGFQQCFPIDVWVMKGLRQLYFRNRKTPLPRLERFTQRHFGPYAGYAQQYLFHYLRMNSAPDRRKS